MRQQHGFRTYWSAKNNPFFFKNEKKHSYCFAHFKVVFLLISLFFFSIKNIKAQCTLSCNASLTVPLDATGHFLLTPSIILTNPACDPNDFSLQITDEGGNIVSNLLDCSLINQTLIASVIRNSDGNSCWGNIVVKDNLAPTIACDDMFIFCYENADTSEIGAPTINDNCTAITSAHLTYSDNFIDLPCYYLQDGEQITAKIERNWSATDDQGNSTSCTQNIFYKRVTTTDVVFPINKDDFESPALDCMDDPTDLSLAGEPTIDGIPITSEGLCELAVSYTDQMFNICGAGGYKIIRTWTVVDWCSSEFILDAQVINVLDKTAPTILCPDDLTVGTNSLNCTGTVTLPPATATDDCSDIMISANWEFGNGFGPFTEVPVGSYPVTYTAQDACGNDTTCMINVTVEDTTPPIAICKNNITATLITGGISTVYATSFDNGSFDNCALSILHISRDGVNFADSIIFDCSDVLLDSIPITLRVYDTNMNYNECSTTIQLQDNILPTLFCPLPVTVHCTEDVLDLALTGNALATDNCNIDSLYFSDENNLNTCSVGTVTRTWTAKDIFGNMTSCIQLIQVEDSTTLTIQFPDDIDLFGCDASTTEEVTGEPTTNVDCESLGITFNDVVFDNLPDVCLKILRTWTVVNWCQYEPNNPNSGGYHTYTQVIKVIDDGSGATVNVAGVITNEKGNPMSNVEVLISGNTEQMVMCTNGVYELLDIENAPSVTITPSRDGDDRNGVTTFDIIFMQRHILGIKKLDSPYKMIAADINRSGTITTFDIVLMRLLILENVTEFVTNTSWRFVDANFVFTNPEDPFKDDFPEFVTVTPTGGEAFEVDFVSIKIGDTNGNASPD